MLRVRLLLGAPRLLWGALGPKFWGLSLTSDLFSVPAEYNWLRNGVVQCYAGTDALGATMAATLATIAAAAPPPAPAEVAAAKHAACHVSKKRQPRGLLTPEGAAGLVDVLLAAHPEVGTRVCRVTAWPKPVSALLLAALTARGVRLSATAHEVTVSLIVYEVGDDSGRGGRRGEWLVQAAAAGAGSEVGGSSVSASVQGLGSEVQAGIR